MRLFDKSNTGLEDTAVRWSTEILGMDDETKEIYRLTDPHIHLLLPNPVDLPPVL
jgi:hypothetical protein